MAADIDKANQDIDLTKRSEEIGERGYKLLLPFVAGGPTVPPKPGGMGDDGQIKKEVMARNIFERMAKNPNQQRPLMIWNAKLEAAACRRISNMADNHWQGHVDPAGHGPDWYVRAEDYVLPPWYWDPKKGDAANHVESLSYGGDRNNSDEEQEEVFWKGLIEHEAHRVHLLGEYETFRDQVETGICVLYDNTSDRVWYLSIITAPPEGATAAAVEAANSGPSL